MKRLVIETKEQELVINSIDGEYTAYPFKEKAYFICNDNLMHDIWNVHLQLGVFYLQDVRLKWGY